MIREKLNSFRQLRQDRKDEAALDYAEQSSSRDPENILTDDKEILGDKASPLILNLARRKTDNLLEKFGDAEAKKDKVGYREKLLAYRDSRVDIKSKRIQQKIARKPDTILGRARKRRLEQKLEDLRFKKKRITHRAGKLEKKRTEKPEKIQKEIDKIIRKKVDAMYRKAQRKEMRENGIKAHNFMKRTEFKAKMTPDMKKKLTQEAILLARKKNIEKGRLDADYELDDTLSTRKVDDEYQRIIE